MPRSSRPHRRLPRRITESLACTVLALSALSVASAAKAPQRPRPPKARSFAGLRTVGPLFNGANTSAHFCTASVVHSRRGDLLLTAAHCVAGTGSGLVFAPGFHDGVSPYGRWVVTAAYVDPAWIQRQNPRRDFAFLTVAPKTVRGRRTGIEQVTGAPRLALDQRRGRRVTVPGYPAGTNNEPITCTASLYYRGFSPAFDCDNYVDGTSGSPWLVHTTGGTEIVAVIGGLHQGGCSASTSYSSPFGAPVLRTYQRAVAHAPGDTAPVAGSDGCG
jgi:V8-like Glu-specific endopeptidase